MRPARPPKDRRPPVRPETGGGRPRTGQRPALRGREPDRAGGRDESDGPLRLWGVHAVAAALANPARVITRLILTENAERRLEAAGIGGAPAPERASPRDLDRMLGADTVHQGVLAEVEPLEEPDLDELCRRALAGGPLVVLDQVTDPHNVGAILRSAAVLGAAGLVMTRRHSPPLGGALAKAASGALEIVPVTLVANLARALAEIGEEGLARIGLDGEAELRIEEAGLGAGTALVLGAEGRGLRRLTRETCDRLARIGGAGALASLNVSNAAAVALYVASQSGGPARP